VKILFVDDKPVTHAYYREQLKKDDRYEKCEIELAFDLRDAIDILNMQFKETDVVVIDLHLPNSDIPSELKSYYQQYGRETQLNEGQLLGLYLKNKKKYLYLSAYQNKYKEEWEKTEEWKKNSDPKQLPICLSKEDSSDKFIKALSELLGI
jgi:CheY-like chemotaxis protein